MTGSHKRRNRNHSDRATTDAAALLAQARAQAAASSSNVAPPTPALAPPAPAGAALPPVPKKSPAQILKDIVADSENVKPLTLLLDDLVRNKDKSKVKRARDALTSGVPVRVTDETAWSERTATFNKAYNPGTLQPNVLQERREVAKVDTLAQILENIAMYPELGDNLEERRSLVQENLLSTGRSVLRDLRNKHEWVSWGSRWEIANLVKRAFPGETELDVVERTLAFLEVSDNPTVGNVISTLKLVADEETDFDVEIKSTIKNLAKRCHLDAIVTEIKPRINLDKKEEPEWERDSMWWQAFRRRPPVKPFYELMRIRLNSNGWKDAVHRFNPLLVDWFEGKGDQRSAAYDVEADVRHVWHWDEDHSPLSNFSCACFGPTPEGNSILIQRERGGTVNGPYRKYVVDSEYNAVGRVKSGGPELFLEVVKEVSADGLIPLFAYSTVFVDELVLLAAAYHAGALVIDGKLASTIPPLESLKKRKGAYRLHYMLNGTVHSVLLLNIGRVIIALNQRVLKQKSCNVASICRYRLKLPGQPKTKIPGLIEDNTKAPNFEAAAGNKVDDKVEKCSKDIQHEHAIVLDFKAMYKHNRKQVQTPFALATSSSKDIASPPPSKRPRLLDSSSGSAGPICDGQERDEEVGENECEDQEEEEEEEEDDDDDEDEDDDEGNDGSVSRQDWNAFEKRWRGVIASDTDWVKRGRPGKKNKR